MSPDDLTPRGGYSGGDGISGDYSAGTGVQTPAAETEEAGKPCRCGCGTIVRPGRRWGREGCRQRFYWQSRLMIDLKVNDPALRARAGRMAEEAVVAAKLGQPRATVDATAPVTHKAVAPPDPRPSCRLRVTPRHWEMLEEIKRETVRESEDGELYHPSYSAIVMELIERELEEVRLWAPYEKENAS